MTIVCGTDFSENAAQAARAAGAIARRLGLPLKLVHVVERVGAELGVGNPHDTSDDPAHEQIGDLAQQLRSRLGIEVQSIVAPGVAHEKLIAIAQAENARLLVVSSLGDKKQQHWLLGSVAERVAQSSPIPVLVVRDAAPIEAWALADKTLHVMVGVELDSTSRPALRWAADLRVIGRSDLLVTQIAYPLLEHQRLGVHAPVPLDHLRPELHELLQRDLLAWAGDISGPGETIFKVTPGLGRVDIHLTALAAQAGADLLVVGTHQRAGIARLWQASVSRGVLHHASCNVACVPRGTVPEDEQAIPTFRRILVPTDFSPLANRAIAVGYGLVAPGGVIHLLHVAARLPRPEDPDPSEQLQAFVPQWAAARGVWTTLELTHDDDVSTSICQAAARLGVDAICMATHGRSGVTRAVLGSQAQEVMQRARQPVMLVPPERDAGSL